MACLTAGIFHFLKFLPKHLMHWTNRRDSPIIFQLHGPPASLLPTTPRPLLLPQLHAVNLNQPLPRPLSRPRHRPQLLTPLTWYRQLPHLLLPVPRHQLYHPHLVHHVPLYPLLLPQQSSSARPWPAPTRGSCSLPTRPRATSPWRPGRLSSQALTNDDCKEAVQHPALSPDLFCCSIKQQKSSHVVTEDRKLFSTKENVFILFRTSCTCQTFSQKM